MVMEVVRRITGLFKHLLMILFLLGSGARSTDCVFNPDAAVAKRPKCTAETPCGDLQYVVDMAEDGDQVLLDGTEEALANLSCPAYGYDVGHSVTIKPKSLQMTATFDCKGKGRVLSVNGTDRQLAGELNVQLIRLRLRNGLGSDGGCVYGQDLFLTVQHCHFYNCTAKTPTPELQGAGGAISVSISKPSSSVRGVGIRMEGSTFQWCLAQGEGGSVAILGKNNKIPMENVILDARSCLFRHSRNLNGSLDNNGGALLIAPLRGVLKLSVDHLRLRNSSINIKNCTFSDCHAARNGGALAAYANFFEFMSFTIEDNTFAGQYARVGGGALYFFTMFSEMSTSYLLRRNVFKDAIAKTHSGGALELAGWGNVTDSFFKMEDNTFKNCTVGLKKNAFGGAVSVIGQSHFSNSTVTVKGGECNKCHSADAGGVVNIESGEAISNLHVSLTDLSISRAFSERGALLSFVSPSAVDTRFELANITSHHTEAESGGLVDMFSGSFAGSVFSGSNITLHNATARGQGGAFSFSSNAGDLNVISQTLTPDPDCDCIAGNLPSPLVKGLLLVYLSNIEANDVKAIGNGMGGFLFGVNTEIYLDDISGSVEASVSGAFAYTSRWSSLQISSGSITAPSGFGSVIQHESKGSLAINSSSFETRGNSSKPFYPLFQVLGSRSLDVHRTEFQCAAYHILRQMSNVSSHMPLIWPAEYENSLKCFPCPSHQVVGFPVEKLDVMCELCPPRKYTLQPGRIIDGKYLGTECTECPFAAYCPGDSPPRALPGYWGAISNSKPVKVFPLVLCPPGYCCTNSSWQHEVASCRSFDTCAPLRKGTGCGRCIEGATEQFGGIGCVRNADCVNAKDKLLWFLVVVLGILVVVLVILSSDPTTRDESKKEAKVSLKAYFDGVKTSFLTYYQSAALVSIAERVAKDNNGKEVNLLSVFSTLANFDLPMMSIERGWCPMQGLTPAGREGFRATKGFFLISIVLVLYGVHKLLHKKCSTRFDPRRYGIAIASIATITFTSLATAVQKLFACQDVPGRGMRVSIDMTQHCADAWWWWVAVLWFALNSCLVPVAMTLGLSMLRDCAATVTEYALALIVPLPSLVIWSRRKCAKNANQNNSQSTAIISSAQAIFSKEVSAFRMKRRMWQGIMLGRRFILVVLSLIPNLYTRTVLNTVSSILFLFIQQRLEPFKSRVANHYESLLLYILSAVSAMNVSRARFLEAGKSDPIGWHESTIRRLEDVAAFLPILAAILGCILEYTREKRRISKLSKRTGPIDEVTTINPISTQNMSEGTDYRKQNGHSTKERICKNESEVNPLHEKSGCQEK